MKVDSKVFKTPMAVVVGLVKCDEDGEKILLQRRNNTGFCDGLFDLSCSGHVEEGETFTAAAIREAKEELGLILKAENLKALCTLHKCDKEAGLAYVKVFMFCSEFDGEPTICEKDKCSELKWFNLSLLPKEQMIDENWHVLAAISRGECYLEYGWDK